MIGVQVVFLTAALPEQFGETGLRLLGYQAGLARPHVLPQAGHLVAEQVAGSVDAVAGCSGFSAPGTGKLGGIHRCPVFSG